MMEGMGDEGKGLLAATPLTGRADPKTAIVECQPLPRMILETPLYLAIRRAFL